MRNKRILIVEPEGDFALQMAAVLHQDGYATTIANGAAEAVREVEQRPPDLLFIRAELPSQNGFSLCARLRREEGLKSLPIVIASSDSSPEAMTEHAANPAHAANAYLGVPFAMDDLRATISWLLPLPAELEEDGIEVVEISDDALQALEEGPPADEGESDEAAAPFDELDESLGDALLGDGPRESPFPLPEVPTTSAPTPPRLPRRERRSAITDDDKVFLDRTFGTIADRKAELLTHSRMGRRQGAVRRELLGTPEGKLDLLRDELRGREAQIARLSEIWAIRERELAQVDDRLHEKEVDIQTLKMQVDDLMRRLTDARDLFVRKEREHGESVDHLLLERFLQEKELIEVVAGKEREINLLRRDLSFRDEDLAARGADLARLQKEIEDLEREYREAEARFDAYERGLLTLLGGSETVRINQQEDLHRLHEERTALGAELLVRLNHADDHRRTLVASLEAQVVAQEVRLRQAEDEKAAAENVRIALEAEIAAAAEARLELSEALEARILEVELELADTAREAETLRIQRDGIHQSLGNRVEEGNHRIAHLEADFADHRGHAERRESELSGELADRAEQVGNLEGELEALRSEMADLESELRGELAAAHDRYVDLEAAKSQGEQELAAEVAAWVERHEEAQESLEATRIGAADMQADLEARIQAIDLALEEARGDSARFQEEARGREAALTDELERLQGELETRGNDAAMLEAALRGEIAERDAELEVLRADSAEQQEQLQQEILRLETVLSELRIHAAEAEVGLQGELAAVHAAKEQSEEQLQSELAAVHAAKEQSEAQLQGELAAVHAAKEQSEAQLQSELAAVHAAKEQSEEQLQGELAAVHAAKKQSEAQLQGELAAVHAAKEQSEAQLQSELAEAREEALNREMVLGDELASRIEKIGDLEGELEGLRQATAEKESLLGQELQASQTQVQALSEELDELREEASRVQEELADVRVAQGEREVRITAELADAHNRAADLENEFETLRSELALKEESWRTELASRAATASEMERRLNSITVEKERQEEQLGRELAGKSEQVRGLEKRLQQITAQFESIRIESTRQIAELEAAEASSRTAHETEAARVGELQSHLERLEAGSRETERELRKLLGGKDSENHELRQQLATTRDSQRRLEEEWRQVRQTLEAQIAGAEARAAEFQAEKDHLTAAHREQLQQRVQKLSELEMALENAVSGKGRIEREAAQKVAQHETRLHDIFSRLQGALREKADLEARLNRELGEISARHRSELERRENQRSLEVGRLQAALQEKTRGLKVAELELGRMKNRLNTAKPAAALVPEITPTPAFTEDFAGGAVDLFTAPDIALEDLEKTMIFPDLIPQTSDPEDEDREV